MELRQLEYFLVVARELHFRHAAEQLHISQPPLSRHIMELESELGTKLFERTTRGVRLTPAGEVLKGEAYKLLQHSDLVKQMIASLPSIKDRKIRFGLVGSTLHSFFPDLVETISRSRPGLSFELHELGSSEQIKALEAGRLDLGILRSWAVTTGVDFVPLMDETLSLVYPAYMQQEGGKDPELPDLAPFPCVAFSNTCAPMLQELADRICTRAGFASRKSLIVDTYSAVLRYVERGLGWSIIPTQALAGTRHSFRQMVLFGIPERITLGLATRSGETDRTLLDLAERTRLFFASPSGDTMAC
jgi:DNA-binding transcriptional LysR family regulator